MPKKPVILDFRYKNELLTGFLCVRPARCGQPVKPLYEIHSFRATPVRPLASVAGLRKLVRPVRQDTFFRTTTLVVHHPFVVRIKMTQGDPGSANPVISNPDRVR